MKEKYQTYWAITILLFLLMMTSGPLLFAGDNPLAELNERVAESKKVAEEFKQSKHPDAGKVYASYVELVKERQALLSSLAALKKRLKADKQSAISEKRYVRKVVKRRNTLIKLLMIVVQDRSCGRWERIEAVRLLGGLRAKGAVNVLVRNIEDIRPDKWKEKTHEILYPCLGALIRIGQPATPALLAALAEADTELKRYNRVHALAAIESPKVAEYCLKREIAQAEKPAHKANFRAALKELRKDFDGFRSIWTVSTGLGHRWQYFDDKD